MNTSFDQLVQHSSHSSAEVEMKGHSVISVNSIETDITGIDAESTYVLPEADLENE